MPNGASDQVQLDVYGELIDAAVRFARAGGRFDTGQKTLLRGLGDDVCRRWREPDDGLWEPRAERRHRTHSKAMAWVALDGPLRLHQAGHL